MTVREPKKRSNLRLKLGGAYFSAQRKLRWLSMRKHFARECSGEDLAYQAFSHHTPLMRKLKDVDMQLQRNKVTISASPVRGSTGFCCAPVKR